MDKPNIPHHFDKRPTDFPTRSKPRYGWRDGTGQPIHAIDEQGNPICGRICSRTQEPCKRSMPFLGHNGRCFTPGHGGKAPGAPLKHGRYSKFLPKAMAESYEDALQDDVLINVREHLALNSAFIEDKLSQMNDPTPAERWKEAKAAHAAVRKCAIAKDWKGVLDALDALQAILENGDGMRQRMREIQSLMATSAQLSKLELARVEKMQQVVTVQELGALQTKIIEVLNRYVEPSILTKLAAELGSMRACNMYPRRLLPGEPNGLQPNLQ